MNLTQCSKCGAAVMDAMRHTNWHLHLEDFEATANEAYDKAEQANNTLYQNNIQI